MADLKDVAAEAGVSLSTVSIILNGKAKERKISKKTQQTVLNAMVKLHYRPNIAAKKLKSGYEDKIVIALFWSFDFRRNMMIRFINGLQNRLTETSDDANIMIHPYQTEMLYKEEEYFSGSYFHGVIVANASMKDLKFLEKIHAKIPVILYNRISNLYSSVNLNDDNIGKIIVSYLYENGYRRPLLLFSKETFPGAMVRRQSIIRNWKLHNIEMVDTMEVNVKNSVKGGAVYGEWLIQNSILLEKTDVIICPSDIIAFGLIHSLQQGGIKIPDDVAVFAIGNGSPEYSIYSNPSITILNIPMEEMAATCYDMLIKRIKEMRNIREQQFFVTKLIERDSTRKKLF